MGTRSQEDALGGVEESTQEHLVSPAAHVESPLGYRDDLDFILAFKDQIKCRKWQKSHSPFVLAFSVGHCRWTTKMME